MSKRYYQGETMRQNVEVTNVKGTLIDPDTIVITIIDPEETVKTDAQNMTKDSTGKYHYDYLLADDALVGDWKTEIEAVKGFTAIEQDEFTVMEAL
ncbi:MAG: hypothetical protein U9N01_04570 [Euryarchaeota archaeon]|nr:hypothetical protein [Euryarchaeota archaeon]